MPISFIVVCILMITTIPLSFSDVDGPVSDFEESGTDIVFDHSFFKDGCNYYIKSFDRHDIVDGIKINRVVFTFITPLSSDFGYIVVDGYYGSKCVFTDKATMELDGNGILLMNGDGSGLNIFDMSIADAKVIPVVGALAGLLLAYFTAEQAIALAAIFATTIIAISLENLEFEIENIFAEDDPDVEVTSEPISEYITVILVDGVPNAVHDSLSDEAATFTDFEYAYIRNLDSDYYYLVYKVDESMVISPIELDRGEARQILDYNSQFYHVWTLELDSAARPCDNANLHVIPYYDECGMAAFPHWHEYDYGEYNNSMSFCGLRYDDYAENEDDRRGARG